MILHEQGFANPIAQYHMATSSLYGERHDRPEDSTVIFGTHRASKLPVAVKVVFKDIEENVCISDLPEVAITDKLSSKYNIVRHVEHFQIDEFIYLVQACMSNGDLRSFIQACFYLYLTEKELKSHVKSMVQALSGMHKEGFLHNDIQPSNFLVHCHRDSRKNFTVKLGGLSRARPIGAPPLVQDTDDS